MPTRAQMETWAAQALKLAEAGRQIPLRKLEAAMQLSMETSRATESIAPLQSFLQKTAGYLPTAWQEQIKIEAPRLAPGQEVLTSGALPPDVGHVYSLVGLGEYSEGVYAGGVRTVRTNIGPGMTAFDVIANVQEIMGVWLEQDGYEWNQVSLAVPLWDVESALGFVPSIL